MLAVGTTVYGPMFFACAFVVAALIGLFVYGMWRKVAISPKQPSAAGVVVRVVLTLVIFVVYIGGVTLGWNALQDFTTNTSTYQSSAVKAEQKAVSEAPVVASEQADQKRIALKERAEVKPHGEALSSFDAAMEAEAEKIRQRSLATKPEDEKN